VVVRKRFNLSGRAFVFVTTTVTDWLPVFADDVIAWAVLDQLRDAVDYYNVSLVGWVLMPSHLHALLGFREVEQLSRFMQSFKILSSKKIKELDLGLLRNQLWHNGNFRLWKPRFDDIVISSEEQFKIKLDYIHNNPVKAGLVSDACLWQYSSASDWLRDDASILKVDKGFSWIK
jgi:putative transposase